MSDRTRATIDLAIILLLAAGLLVVCAPPADATSIPAAVYYQTNVEPGPATWATPVTRWFEPGDQDRAMTVLGCESGYDPDAANPHSTALGGFQFLAGTWTPLAADLGLDPYPTGPTDPDQAAHAAAELVARYRAVGWPGWAAWNASEPCWGNTSAGFGSLDPIPDAHPGRKP